MSVIEDAKFKCPQCGEIFEAKMYKAINTNEDEKYRHMLVNGEFFKYHCPHCDKVFMAVYPLSYTDSKNKFMLQYTPRNIEEEILKAVNENRGQLPQDYTLRVCDATYDLVEKMIIFENRFDDRAIECCKVVIHKAFLERYPDKPVTHIYLNFDNKGNFFYDVLFNDENNQQKVSRAPFDVKLYNQVYKDFRKDFKDSDLVVDYGYGLHLMTRQMPKKEESKEETK